MSPIVPLFKVAIPCNPYKVKNFSWQKESPGQISEADLLPVRVFYVLAATCRIGGLIVFKMPGMVGTKYDNSISQNSFSSVSQKGSG